MYGVRDVNVMMLGCECDGACTCMLGCECDGVRDVSVMVLGV